MYPLFFFRRNVTFRGHAGRTAAYTDTLDGATSLPPRAAGQGAESEGEWTMAGFDADVEDLERVIEYLSVDYGYEVNLSESAWRRVLTGWVAHVTLTSLLSSRHAPFQSSPTRAGRSSRPTISQLDRSRLPSRNGSTSLAGTPPVAHPALHVAALSRADRSRSLMHQVLYGQGRLLPWSISAPN